MSKVYLIGAYRSGEPNPDAVKIGVAQDPRRRLDEIQTGNHLHCRIIAQWLTRSTRNAYAIEANAHRRFKKSRMRGEWFRPRVDLIVDYVNTQVAMHVDLRNEVLAQATAEMLDAEMLASNEFLASLRVD